MPLVSNTGLPVAYFLCVGATIKSFPFSKGIRVILACHVVGIHKVEKTNLNTLTTGRCKTIKASRMRVRPAGPTYALRVRALLLLGS